MSVQNTAMLRRVQPAAAKRPPNPFRLTPNAVAVLEELSKSAQPQKAYNLLEQLRGRGIHSPMSVYRALDQLVERGLVRKVESLNAFVVLPERGAKSVLFMICTTCGKTVTQEIDAAGQTWLEQAGLDPSNTYIESRRTCVGCP